VSPRFTPTKYEGIFQHESGSYWLRSTVHTPDLQPKVIDRSLKTKSITQAKERADQIKRKIMSGAEEAGPTRVTFDEAFTLVLKMQANPKNDEDTTLQAESIINHHLRPWFKKHCPYLTGSVPRYPDGFIKQHEQVWTDYTTEASARKPPAHLFDKEGKVRSQVKLDTWLEKNKTPRKLEHDRRYLIMALIRAHKREWIKRKFDRRDFPLNEVSEPIGQFIPDEDVQRILNGLSRYPKPYLQVLMAVIMGMRRSEILHLHRDEVDLKRREIVLDPKRLKTRRSREVPIPIAAPVFPLLEAAYRTMETQGGQYLFPAQYHNVEGRPVDWNKPQDDNRHFWDKVRSEEGLEVRFHDLRHTAITNMVKAGLPDTAIRKICGVEEGTMRRIYAHLEDELKGRFRDLFSGKFEVKHVAVSDGGSE
jgi:integrase